MTTQTKTTMPDRSREAKAGWRKVKLGKVMSTARIDFEKVKTSEYKTAGRLHIFDQGSDDIAGYTDNPRAEYKGKSPAILFGDHTLKLKIAKPPFAIGADGVQILEPDESLLDRKFFYYAIKGLKVKSYGYERHMKYLRELEIACPTITDQKRIANILSAFDDKIELNNKISRTLEQMAQAIFSACACSHADRKEWLLKTQNSKLKTQKLSDFVKIISGHPFSSKLYSQNKRALGVVTIKNVQDGNFVTSCDSFIDEQNVPKNINQECRIHDGDILLSLTGNVGRVCFIYGGQYLLNQRVAKLKPKDERDRAFCYFLFRRASVQNQLINMAKGSAQPNLSPVETGEIELTIPSREVLAEFSELAGPIYERLIKNAVENQKLAALRDLLLPKLMSGEIRV